ncbi:MAG: PilZ domain-containing protein [Lentisphaeria bacterium]|nr:PilZ domain-containing protein [Lentisphaeria bacterium]
MTENRQRRVGVMPWRWVSGGATHEDLGDKRLGGDKMTDQEKRRSERFDSKHLLHYKVLDARDGQLGDGMARTLNVSEGGLLLETNTSFEPGQELSVSIGLEEEEVDVVGEVRHCKRSGDGLFTTGVKFENLDKDGARVLAVYLKLFETGK